MSEKRDMDRKRAYQREYMRRKRDAMTPEERLQERIQTAITLLQNHGYTVEKDGENA